MEVLVISPISLRSARGELEQRGGALCVKLSAGLDSELAQLPTLLTLNQQLGVVILAPEGVSPSKDGGTLKVTMPMMVARPPCDPPGPAVRVIQPDFAVCFASVSAEMTDCLQAPGMDGSSLHSVILAPPVKLVKVCTVSHFADRHLQEMAVSQAESFGIRRPGLIVSYMPPIFGPEEAVPLAVEPTTSLWLSGSGEPHPVFDGITEVRF